MLTRFFAIVLTMSFCASALSVERLFTSHADRQLLDTKRFGKPQQLDEQAQVQRQSLKLNGVVRINQMRPNIWLNGAASDLEKDEELSLGQGSNTKAIELKFLNRNVQVSLKPGQTLDLLTGKQEEGFSVPQATNSSADSNRQDSSVADGSNIDEVQDPEEEAP